MIVQSEITMPGTMRLKNLIKGYQVTKNATNSHITNLYRIYKQNKITIIKIKMKGKYHLFN